MLLRVIVPALLAGCLSVQVSNGEEPPGPAPSFDSLTKEFQQAVAVWSKQYNEKPDKSKRIERFSEWPGWRFLPRFQALAEKHPASPDAFRAWTWIIEHARFIPASNEVHYAAETRALEVLRRDFLTHEQLPSVCISIGEYATPAREAFLRACMTEAKSRALRGMAQLSLAELLCQKMKIRLPAWFDLPIEDPLEQYFADHMAEGAKKYLRESNPVAHLDEVLKLFEATQKDYADVSYPRPVPQLKYVPTLAQVAKHRRSGLEGLAIGQEAPATKGQGLDGRTGNLKSHRGKVVVLTFWATWCGPCLAKIPSYKRLVKKFDGQPFVMLGVNCDDNSTAAQNFTMKQELPWFSWSDPISGGRPIAMAWHVFQLPSLMVLDHQGKIRFKDLDEKELEQAVEVLLRDVPKSSP